MTVATGTRTVGAIVTLCTDARWETYAGTAPATASTPFVTVKYARPLTGTQSQCFEDFGVLRSRWRIIISAASEDQARWMLGELVAIGWTDMILEDSVSPVVIDPTEQPGRYEIDFVLRDYQVTDR